MKITKDYLVALRACEGQVALFEATFPNGVDLTRETLTQAAGAGLRVSWLPENSPGLAFIRRKYDKAREPARRAYDEAVALARRAYDEAVAPAWRAYDEAVALALRKYEQRCAVVLADMLA